MFLLQYYFSVSNYELKHFLDYRVCQFEICSGILCNRAPYCLQCGYGNKAHFKGYSC